MDKLKKKEHARAAQKRAYVPPHIEDLGQFVPLVGSASGKTSACGEDDVKVKKPL